MIDSLCVLMSILFLVYLLRALETNPTGGDRDLGNAEDLPGESQTNRASSPL
jgi:hypothetical protein